MLKVLAFSFLLCLSATVYADTIYLKSGRQIECDSAWEDGKEVKYTISNGTVGIPKAIVAKIVKGEAKKPDVDIPAPLKAEAGGGTTVSQQTIDSTVKQAQTDPSVKPKLAQMYTSTGLKELNQKDLTGALEDFQKAYSYEKNRTTTYNLALIYFTLQDDFNAELYFNEMLKLNQKDTEALNYLGEIAWRNEKLDDAQAYWQKSASISPDPHVIEKLRSLKKEKGASDAYENATSRHFLIKYDGGNAEPNLVREINDYLEDVYQDLSNQFDTYPSSPFIVVLYPQRQYMNVTDAPAWSGGVNDGKIKLPVRGISSINDELKGVLTHELAHSFVNYKTSDNCPTWLQEGLAQHAEGQTVGSTGEEVLRKLAEEKRLPSFAKLGGFSGTDSSTAQVLYLMSLSFTDYLLDRYPSYLMNSLLDELGKNAKFVEAFEDTYSMPLTRAEDDWKNQLVQ